MSDVQKKFEAAAVRVKKLDRKPANETLLELYSLYKQATEGDVSGDRPGFLDPVGRAKYDAWKKKKGLAKDAAMEAYTRLVEELCS